MRAPRVLIHSDDWQSGIAIVGRDHPDLDLAHCDSYAGLDARIRETGAEVVFSTRFAGGKDFPRAALTESDSVRWIAVGGSGTDHLQPWDSTRVTVTNSAGVAADMMAEYVLGTLLSFSLDLRGFACDQRGRRWNAAGRVMPIAGRTMLILGLGKTGAAVARRAQALGLRTLGVRARPQPTPGFDEVHGTDDLPSLWPRADVVVCCVPLLDSTRGLIGPAAFAAMRPGVVLIDVSRGGVVDEGALLAALDAGRLGGAALDVFTTEPLPPDHPLWAREDVIVTPHCSSVDAGWQQRAFEMFSRNLARYRRGEPPDNVVDPARGY